MKSSRERDEAIERLLRRPAEPPANASSSDSCLDAETVAAFVGGGLSAAQLSAAEGHLADCDRCQALVAALGKVESPTAPTATVRNRWLLWAAPLAAAAAIATVWVAVPRHVIPSSATVDEVRAGTRQPGQDQPVLQKPQSPPQQPTPPPPQRATAPRPSTPLRGTDERAERFKDASPAAPADALITRQESPAVADKKQVAAPSASIANPFGALNAPLGGRLSKSNTAEIVSSDEAVRWRIAGSDMQRSVDGGVTWTTQPTGSADALTAGASPSPLVCWVVGQRGTVVVSVDGRTWRRVPFPETTDLSAVHAVDATTATVTTTDGRTFTTSDAGASWRPGSLQDF